MSACLTSSFMYMQYSMHTHVIQTAYSKLKQCLVLRSGCKYTPDQQVPSLVTLSFSALNALFFCSP